MLRSKKVRKSVANGTEADDDRLSWLMNWPSGLVRPERGGMLDPAYACAHYRARLAQKCQDKPSLSSASLCKQSVRLGVAMLRDIPHVDGPWQVSLAVVKDILTSPKKAAVISIILTLVTSNGGCLTHVGVISEGAFPAANVGGAADDRRWFSCFATDSFSICL